MALKAVHVADVPTLDQVPESPSSLLSTSRLSLKGPDSVRASFKTPKFLVIGHRGKGMNALASSDRRLKVVKENTVLSFNEAGRFPIDLVEFDVQVNKTEHAPALIHTLFWDVLPATLVMSLRSVRLRSFGLSFLVQKKWGERSFWFLGFCLLSPPVPLQRRSEGWLGL
ncbi:hypothetical protein Taro_039739 [Colocasia esculenta]|uniref:glycerophosphodiester phosphodiesterase n=1 Tax=Colocasia esculenta TaxID=4460 RepID=A0A843WHC6_COLES|nr:hypothetical protein [Colocasia esculenta]